MNIKPLKTKADYQNALKRIEQLMHAKFGTPQNEELELLTMYVEKYEEDNFPFPRIPIKEK